MPTLTERAGIHVLDLGDDENRFSPAWLRAVEDALDKVVAAPAPLITTGSGKFYSNGLDLEWLSANIRELEAYTARVQALFARLLTLPVPTVSAVNGHAFGGGAMLAVAHDWRVMRVDRGYFCFPEVDMQIAFAPGMAALVQSKLTPRQALDTMTTGRRFTGRDALAVGLVDALETEAALLEGAASLVGDLAGKPGDTLGAIKTTMYAEIVRRLTHGGT